MTKSPSTLALLVFAPLFALLTGCMDITGRGPAPLASTLVTKEEDHPRPGHVYCMRGFLGIFSEGMDALAEKINTKLGVSAVSVANEERDRLKEWIVANYHSTDLHEGPLVLLGHSYGADDMIRVAEFLKKENITVDLVVLIDPVTPPKVPDNVKRVYCVYKSSPATDWYPAWRGVPAEVMDPAVTPLTNLDLRTTDVGFDTSTLVHPTIDKSEGVHGLVMAQIKIACPLRANGMAHQPTTSAHVTGPDTSSKSIPAASAVTPN